MENRTSKNEQIDELDRKILFELDLNCRTPSVEIAEKLKTSRQTVDYRISKLCQMQVIQSFHACVSLTKLGYRLYKFYLKLRNLPSRKVELKNYIHGLGAAYWIGGSSGNWDLLIGFFYTDETELFPITNTLNSKFNDVIVTAEGHTTVTIDQFPKNYLISETFPHKEYIGKISKADADELDLKILAELVQDARIPTVRLSEKLGVATAAIKRRISRLENMGVIFQYSIGVDISKLGLQIYKTIITLNRYTAEDHERFFKYISKITALQFFLRNLWTVELELAVKTYSENEEIIEKIRANFPSLIKSLDTLLIDSDEWTSAFTNLLSKEN